MKLSERSNSAASERDAETILITPDFSFLREVEEAGGKKIPLCYQWRRQNVLLQPSRSQQGNLSPTATESVRNISEERDVGW